MSRNDESVRMIWVTPKYPLGTPDGARLATSSLLRQLTRRNVTIDLICLTPYGELADEKLPRIHLGVRSCFIIRRNASKWFQLPRLRTPFTFRSFVAAGVRRQFQRRLSMLLSLNPDHARTYVVFDGLHTCAALAPDWASLPARCSGLIYRAHNVETVLWEQSASQARTPWTRWLFEYQARLVRDFESCVARQVDVIAPVSDEDGQKFEALGSGARVSVTRIGIDFPDPQRIPAVAQTPTLELLFLGRLDWLPNRNGLHWFLSRVWPVVARAKPTLLLKIAGAGDARWLQPFVRLPRVEIVGRVDSVEGLYHSAALSVAPLFQGSGTRVKIIEAARYMRGVMTTTLGAEGTGLMPGLSYIRAETEAEWIDALNALTLEDCRRMGIEAYQGLRKRFDGGTIAGELLQSLADTRSKR